MDIKHRFLNEILFQISGGVLFFLHCDAVRSKMIASALKNKPYDIYCWKESSLDFSNLSNKYGGKHCLRLVCGAVTSPGLNF